LLAYERMRADIVRGVLVPDARLRVADMSQRYRCGLIPMREALNRLAGESMVSYSGQRGFAVAPVSADDLRDLTRARVLLLEVAIRESVLHGDEAWEERIVLAQHRLVRTARYLDEEQRELNPLYDALHREFHTALVSGCGSQWIVAMCQDLFDRAERYRCVSRLHCPRPRENQHKAMVEALLGKRVEEAIRLSREHVESTCTFALRAMAEREVNEVIPGVPGRTPAS
jgi:DNA-binding GntR family transcriptional regulator